MDELINNVAQEYARIDQAIAGGAYNREASGEGSVRT